MSGKMIQRHMPRRNIRISSSNIESLRQTDCAVLKRLMLRNWKAGKMRGSLEFGVLLGLCLVPYSANPQGCQESETATDCAKNNGWTNISNFENADRARYLRNLMEQDWFVTPQCGAARVYVRSMLHSRHMGWGLKRGMDGEAFGNQFVMIGIGRSEDEKLRTLIHEATHSEGGWGENTNT